MSVHQPIFILGSPRSFTSVICAIMGQHPQAYGVPELNLFVSDTLEEFLERLTGVRQFQRHGLLRTIAQLYSGEQTSESVEMAYRWIQSRLHWSTGEVYIELCRKVQPLRIVDKSPVYSTNAEILDRIRKAFPDAYYLHLVRHPRTQGKSMMNMAHGAMAIISNSIDYSTDPPTVDPQISWYQMQQTIMDFLSGVPNSQQMRLRGEDILNQPSVYLKKICEWLDFSWDESTLEIMLRPQDSSYASFGPYNAHLGNDPNFLKSPAYRQQTIAPSKMEGSLPWRPDNRGFFPEVVELVLALGYE